MEGLNPHSNLADTYEPLKWFGLVKAIEQQNSRNYHNSPTSINPNEQKCFILTTGAFNIATRPEIIIHPRISSLQKRSAIKMRIILENIRLIDDRLYFQTNLNYILIFYCEDRASYKS